MRTRNWIELLTLTTNIYLLSRDKELMESIEKFSGKFKTLCKDFLSDQEKKEAIDFKSILFSIYRKLRLLSVADIERLEHEITALRKELALAEARIVALENHRKAH